MLHEKWLPTPLLKKSERLVIPIVKGKMNVSWRRSQIFIRLSSIILKIFFLKITRRLDVSIIGRLFGDFCQQMGVLWVKLGQLLSMRSDLFPSELCIELARLQDRVEGFSPRVARKILEKELGAPIENFFNDFEETPYAAASIAQVHRAYLVKEQAWVAIKIRRPEVDLVFSRDMSIIRSLFMFLHRFSILSYMRWPEMLWELEQVFIEELDYRYEVSNQKRLRKTLAGHNIYVPKVYSTYCTKQVLVMEYIDAVPMSDFLRIKRNDPHRSDQWCQRNDIDVEIVGMRLFFSYLRQVLEDNLFHADIHPGNILLLRKNRIALLDFGSVGTNEMDLLRKYDLFLEGITTGQFAKAVDVFLMIMPGLPNNLLPVKEELQRDLTTWDSRCRVKELPYKEKSTNTVFDRMTKVLARYGVTINWAFFKVLRGWTTMDTSLRELIPAADLPRLMQAYTKSRRKREFRKGLRQLPGDFLRLQNLIDYPREFSEMAIYRGASVRRLAQVFEGAATRVSKLVATFFRIVSSFLFLTSVFFTGIFIRQHADIFIFSPNHPLQEIIDILPRLDFQVWILLIVFLLYGSISLSRLSRRFRQQE